MRKSIFIHDQVDVMNHINANNISEDIHMLVEEIREKVRLKRHKWVDKKITRLKWLATRDLDYLEEIWMLDILGTELCKVRRR